MTTLKNINKTIEDGNDDLENLNKNFTKWFELQKRNRLDDLENAREMKRAMKSSGAVGAAAGTGSDSKDAFKFPKLLTGIAATLAALLAAREVFGDPGTGRDVSKRRLIPTKYGRTVKTGGMSRAQAKITAAALALSNRQIANIKAELKAEQLKTKALAAEARRRFLENKMSIKRNKIIPNNLIMDSRIKRNVNSKLPLNDRLNMLNEKVNVMPNAEKAVNTGTTRGRASMGGRGGMFVTSNSGITYLRDSPRGQDILRRREVYRQAQITAQNNKVKNFNAVNNNIQSRGPSNVITGKFPNQQSNITSNNVKGGAGFKPMVNESFRSKTSVIRAGLMNTVANVGKATMGMGEKFAKGSGALGRKIMTMKSATGNFVQDAKDLMAHRQGANLPKHWKLILRLGSWLVNKLISAVILYKWFYAMTDPTTSMKQKVVITVGLIGALIGFKLGAAIGTFIGTFAIAIPLVGSVTGGLLGGYLGMKKGQFVAAFMARMLLGMPQPEIVRGDLEDRIKRRVDKATAIKQNAMAISPEDHIKKGQAIGLAQSLDPNNPEGSASSGTSFPVRSASMISSANMANQTRFLRNDSISANSSTDNAVGGHAVNLATPMTVARTQALANANLRMLMASGKFGNAGNGGVFLTETNNSNNDNSSAFHYTFGEGKMRTIDINHPTFRVRATDG